MKVAAQILTFSLSLFLITATMPLFGQTDLHYLWQIGVRDNSAGEFAAQPSLDVRFVNDGFFIAGKSTAKNSWPYAQPGPDDNWAGNRRHTNTIVFGLQHAGDCRLQIKLADVGPNDLRLQISVNGKRYNKQLPAGAGKAIYGTGYPGKPANIELDIPAADLKEGNNRIDITTTRGSWLVYDWLGLEAPKVVVGKKVSPEVTAEAVKPLPFLVDRKGVLWQPMQFSLLNWGAKVDVVAGVEGLTEMPSTLRPGHNLIEMMVPAVYKDSVVSVVVTQKKKPLFARQVTVHPVPKRTIYILPHSHNDIGYTEIQTKVEEKQINNLLTGMEYARQTSHYPEGARFVWNLEGTYAADLFMQRATPRQKAAFVTAVKNGEVALNGMYLNTLTGLCRPEELLQLFKHAGSLAASCGTTVKSAMISDVPGYTWGMVTAMAQAGIRYFSAAPNNFDRIGDILQQWEDKPFWWVGPSGKDKVLVWIPYRGYALSHGLPQGLNPAFVEQYMQLLDDKKFPYDISYIRWSGHGDNATPDKSICDFVKDWNSRYAWPRFIISSTTTAFEAFEKEYGDQLPMVQGDWTGYWEDGAGSSAFETGQNRQSSSRLTQAGAAWAMVDPAAFPAQQFHKAWSNVLLYSEHTWGADESVVRPLTQKTMEQWVIKKSYATKADELSEQLLDEALAQRPGEEVPDAVDIINTSSWNCTGLVTLSPALSKTGDILKDATGQVIPAQRLSTGELAFVAQQVPSLASKRYFISAGSAETGQEKISDKLVLDNGVIRAEINPHTGAIKSLTYKNLSHDFVDTAGGEGLNDYLFLEGDDTSKLQRIQQVDVQIKENGPVLTTLRISSAAPGCTRLVRDMQLVNGFDYLTINNMLDKKPAALDPYPGDWGWANTGGKESLNMAFPFSVPNGQMKLEIPMAVIRPEKDQLPGSCKNWLEVGTWADVSNENMGVSWFTLDAPLVEVGGITANLLGGQGDPAVWRKNIAPTQRLYSWALNNHWETNYRAYQLGAIHFRYAVRPHKTFDPVETNQLATGMTQPLIAVQAKGISTATSLLTVEHPSLQVLALKPSTDGRAIIVSLYNPGDTPASSPVSFHRPVGKIYLSNTVEDQLEEWHGPVQVPAHGVVTLRAQLTTNQ